MKTWMWKAICVLALTGFSAMAEVPPAGDHGAGPSPSALGALLGGPAAASVAPQAPNPAETRQARIPNYNDVCATRRPGGDTSVMESALNRIFSR